MVHSCQEVFWVESELRPNCVPVQYPTNSLGHIETGPQLKVSSDRLKKRGIEPRTSDYVGL